jgi:hypothetical protein
MSMIVVMLILVKFSILYCKVQSFVVTLQKNKKMGNEEWGIRNVEWDILFKYIFLIIILNCI